MSFLFKSKKQQGAALPTPARNIGSPHAQDASLSAANSASRRDGDVQPGVQPTPMPSSSVSASVASLSGTTATEGTSTATGPRQLRERSGSDLHAPRHLATTPSRPLHDASLYPWAQFRLQYPSAQAVPFPRYGAAVNSLSSKDGHVYLMGGLINGSTVKGDLWIVEAGSPHLASYPVATTSEGPGPRVGHASLLVGNAFIVFGGDTKLEEGDVLDDTLYLLNTSSKQWSRALPVGPKPSGRYGHTLNILGSKIYVFGGQVEGAFFNDLVAFDLNDLQHPNGQWEMLIRNSHDGGPAPGQSPPARTNHTVISFDEKLYLFGGTDGIQWFNDVWSYDNRTNSWSQLECIGYIPSPREGHAAALVDDVMYILGGRTEEGNDLGDLAAFRITTRRWYTFQNMGPSPSPRSGHSMTAFRKQIIVLGGEPSSAPRDPEELSLMYILDTAKIRYPNEQQAQQPHGERMGGMRRPSGERGDRIGASQNRAMSREGLPHGVDGMKRMGPPSQGLLTGQAPAPRAQDASFNNGPGPGPPISRPARAPAAQAPSGPPPQQQAPQPRINGVVPLSSQTRNFGPPIDTERAAAFGRDNTFDMQQTNSRRQTPTLTSPVRENAQPSVDARVDHSHSQSKVSAYPKESMDSTKSSRAVSRSGSSSRRHPTSLGSIDDSRSSGIEEMLTQSLEEADLVSKRYNEPPVDSGFGSSPALSHQADELLRELEAARNRNAWYASELALARKAGYLPNASNSPVLDERAADSFADDDRPLLEALLKMRSELSTLQAAVDSGAVEAAGRIAEIEKQRDAAITEAAYAKAKLAAHGASQVSSPHAESARGTATPDFDRPHETNHRLAASLEARQNLTLRLQMLTTELEAERRARQMAEETAEAAEKRVTELDSYKQRSVSEMEGLKAELHVAQTAAREESANSAEALASSKLLRVDKEELATKLSNALADAREHVSVLESLRAALTASTDKAALLERKLEEETRQRDNLEQKLVQLRTEHEQRTAELETTARHLRDAEELAESNAAEARTHRQAVLSGLGKATERDEDEHAAVDERVTILQQQVEAANAMIRKNLEHADNASEKLRRAEERIAGLEAYQEQASREGVTIRKQLQSSMRDAQALQAEKNMLEQQLASQQLDANAISVQHGALKELLSERGISPAEMRRSRIMDSPSSRYGTPDTHRVRELEQQLEASMRAHEETKASFEEQWNEATRENEEKLVQLDNDYQSAVKYLRGTEKMLSKMKQELQRYKTQQVELESQLSQARQVDESRNSQQSVPPDWEEERDSLRKQIEDMQENLKHSVAQLERQMQDVQSELRVTQAERDHSKEASLHLQKRLDRSAEQARKDLEGLRSENDRLETRAIEAEQQAQAAEQKVQLLLDQVETSVGNYRRQSVALSQAPNGVGPFRGRSLSNNSINHNNPGNPFASHHGHHDSIASLASIGHDSTYSNLSTTPNENEVDGRNSLALDNLATELDALRTHWETTSKTYRLSDRSEYEKRAATPTSAGDAAALGANGEGAVTESLADWRRRLDLGEDAAGRMSRGGDRESLRDAGERERVRSPVHGAGGGGGAGGGELGSLLGQREWRGGD